jgi:hypothetical protein
MTSDPGHLGKQACDRWFLLGEKRNELLALREVQRYAGTASVTRTTYRSMATSRMTGMRVARGYQAARRSSARRTGWPA